MNDQSTQVQSPAHTGNKTGGTLNVSAVLLIEPEYLISLMSFVKSSRTSERVKVRDLVTQWLSAGGECSVNTGSNPCLDGQQNRGYPKCICCSADRIGVSYFSNVICKVK